MIGLQASLLGEERQPDEDVDTRNLEKRDLYEMVNETYFIPPYSSKGVTRFYLIQVHKARVFRVKKNELKYFEVELTPDMQRRVSNISNAILVRKLNVLLCKTGRQPLGFSEFDVPDQGWLYRVARYIDTSSITEFFDAPVKPEPPLNSNPSQISRIHHGRLAAANWFFRDKATKSNKRVWEAVREISENYRSLVNHRVNIEILEKELAALVDKRTNLQCSLEDMLSKASITYTSIENPAIKPEMVLSGGEQLTPQMREVLTRNARM
jgi:hypothetical protein